MKINLQDYEKKCHFRPLICPQGWKLNFKNFSAHKQDVLIHILENQLSTPKNVDVFQVINFIWQKTSLFDPHMTQGGKIKIPNPYCTSARLAQSYPRVLIINSWTCRCSSSDNLYRKKERRFSTLILALL